MTQISSLSALTGAGVTVADDLLPIVDMSETGIARNKKITIAEFFLGIQELIDDRMDAVLVAGDNVTITYNDGAGTLEIAATPPGPGDITGFNEAVDDRVGALIDSGAGISVAYDDGAGTLVITNIGAGNSAIEWAPNFTADSDLYIPVVEAMTIDQGNAEIGTGTITFEKSTTAAPGTFSSTTLPASVQAGAWLKVIASGVTGFVATHLVRTA